MKAIAQLYELLAMADWPKLPTGISDAKISKFKFSLILAMNKSCRYPDECFFEF